MASMMPPPPPRPPKPSSTPDHTLDAASSDHQPQLADALPIQTDEQKLKENASPSTRPVAGSTNTVYSIPNWSAAPAFPFFLEVIKDGASIETLDVSGKGAFMFGRSDQCDFMLEHPSISRFHAVLQFKRPSDVFIYDLGSTHGTIVNKKKVISKTYTTLHVGDLLKFGLSSRLYVLQGPEDLMPKAGLLTKAQKELLRQAENAVQLADREASLQRAKREALEIDGATWGMKEDAFEYETQEDEEITWQTYKGQLTEKQQKTLEKIHKRNEKISSLKREIDAIQVKEIPQGGLTQGQQTQVARNQQRIEQLLEELDNLEETLNQSIQESVGARANNISLKKEDEISDISDEDDFYDRTNTGKTKTSVKKNDSSQVVETVETLLEKREKIMKEIETLSGLLESEEKSQSEAFSDRASVDPLDAFMTSVSSKLENERVMGFKREIEKQRHDLERVISLLKIADPTGEQQRKWQSAPKSQTQLNMIQKQKTEMEKENVLMKQKNDEASQTATVEEKQCVESVDGKVNDDIMIKKGPLWLGQAKQDVVETKSMVDVEDNKTFLEYKDRHKTVSASSEQETLKDIAEDAGGLIIRKTKGSAKETKHSDEDKDLWEGAAAAAADTVALLLRHQRGLGAVLDEFEESEQERQTNKAPKKRKLGPEKPDFLNKEVTNYQTWVPPTGQTGDGRTKLNEKYGY